VRQAAILPELRAHMDTYAEPGPEGRVFVGPKGGTPRRRTFNRLWKRALRDAGANPDLHLHDLRHTGGTLAAQTGATLRELMTRLGHSTPRAALIYQHATSERDKRIADGLNLMIEGSSLCRRRRAQASRREPVQRLDLVRIWRERSKEPVRGRRPRLRNPG
jgi:integrase